MLFVLVLAGLLAADAKGYGPEALCNYSGGVYEGTVEVGGTKEGNMKATVPYCTALPFEKQLAPIVSDIVDEVKDVVEDVKS